MAGVSSWQNPQRRSVAMRVIAIRRVVMIVIQSAIMAALACWATNAQAQAPHGRHDSAAAKQKTDTICAEVLGVTDTADGKGQVIKLRIASGDTVRYGWVKTERAPIFVTGLYDFILGSKDSLVRRGDRKKTCVPSWASAGGPYAGSAGPFRLSPVHNPLAKRLPKSIVTR